MTVVELTPLVGREAELDSLAAAAAHGREGAGRLVVVAGEAGIGKTRLCDELAARARLAGMRVAWVACSEDGGLPALHPLSELCRQLGVPIEAIGAEGASAVARDRFVGELAGLLRAGAATDAAVLVIDDLQWADPDTCGILGALAPMVRTMSLLIVVTVRDAPGASMVPEPMRRHGTMLRLEGLAPSQLQVLAELARGPDVGPDVGARLHRWTRGNPLFASEFLHQLDSPSDLSDASLRVPPTVRALLDERLEALGDDVRDLLRTAAVAGVVFDVALVAAASERDPSDVLGAVAVAVGAGVALEAQPGVFRFAHPLFRRVLLDDLGVARRSAIHRRLGDALASAHRHGDAAWLSAVASHYLAAGPAGTAGRAVVYGQQAAAAAFRSFAYDRAAELYRQVLDADILEPGHADRIALLLDAGRAVIAAGDLQGGRSLLLTVADLARPAARPSDLAAAALSLGGSGFEIELFDRVQIALLEESYATLPPTDAALRSRVASRLSVALSLTDDTEERRRALADEAVRLATSAADDAALASALAARCDVAAGPEHVAERRNDAQQIVRLAQRRGELDAELLGRRLEVVAAFEAGDMTGVDAAVAGFARLADLLARPQYEWYVHLWRAARAIMRGRVAEHATEIATAEALGRAAGSVNCDILTMAQRWFASLEVGEPDQAIAMADARVPAGRWSEMGPQMLPLEVGRRAIAGRRAEARAVLDAGMPSMQRAGRDAEWLTMVAQVGVLAVELDARAHLPWIYDALLPYAEVWSLDGIGAYSHGPVHRQLGVVAAALGEESTAAEHFDAALGSNVRAGADLLVARTLLDRGRSLHDAVALGEASDRYGALGIEVAAAGASTTATDVPARASAGTFRRTGDSWQVGFAGTVVTLRDAKGLRDLATLLGRPGREVAALDLASPGGAVVVTAAGPAIDDQARRAYQRRIIELEHELDAADAAADTTRSARLAAERDALVDQLTAAYGLGGRDRRAGSSAERARTAVTARLRDAIRRIEEHHPAAGRHLARSVRTGTFCSYDPEQPVDWQL